MTEQEAERIVRELAARERPEDVRKVDRQFADRLDRLERDKQAPREMLDQARVLWRMLSAPDDLVPFGAKAMIMGALAYLVSPLDVIPDRLGYAGHLDDAMVIRFVYGRLGAEIEAFRAQGKP
jgi:uncharacterized membrane protein YkvA (DUF1232 family)